MPLGSKFPCGRVNMRSLSDAASADQVFDWGEAHVAGDVFRVYRFEQARWPVECRHLLAHPVSTDAEQPLVFGDW